MKNKGFTLVELLAVIVILGIISTISMPMALSTIEAAKKGAAESSMLSYIKATEQAVMIKLMNATSTVSYDAKYSVEGINLVKIQNISGDIKKCLNAKTNVPEDPIGTSCGENQKINPEYFTFKIEVKGQQPNDPRINLIEIDDNVVTKAQLKFGEYRVSYFYDRSTGKTKYCSTDGAVFLEKNQCA